MTASRETILAAVKEATRIPSALPEPPEELEDDIEKTLESITPAHGEALRGGRAGGP